MRTNETGIQLGLSVSGVIDGRRECTIATGPVVVRYEVVVLIERGL